MTRAAAIVGVCILGGLVPAAARAQGSSLDVSAGRTVYQPISSNVTGSSAIATLRHEWVGGAWVYGSGGAPLQSDDSAWGAGGAGQRFSRNLGASGLAAGFDIGGHGYLFRDGVLGGTGAGATIDAIPYLLLPAGDADLEFRGGWRGHTLSYGGTRESRGVIEAGIRAVYGLRVRTQVDARWVQAAEGGFPFIGSTVAYAGTPLQLWLEAGKWLSDDLDDVSWGAGIGIGRAVVLWARAWQEAPDPLYWNLARRSWSVGLTTRLGRPRSELQQVRTDPDGVLIAIPLAESPAGVSIAGDFNGWQPAPMRRDGSQWVVRVPLDPGVYRYAFRSEDGRWFVPASNPSRRDDGMGGHVAVLVVGD